MFKKIEIWILYLVMLLSLLVWISSIVLVRQGIEGTTKAGPINIEPLTKPLVFISRIPEQFLREVIIHPFRVNDPWKKTRSFFSQDGFKLEANYDESSDTQYLLLSRFDGNVMQGVVELINLRNFEVLHRWNPDLDAFNDSVEKVGEFKNLDKNEADHRSNLMHPLLTSDGGLIFGWHAPLRKIDSCSNLIFQNTHDSFHHSIELDAEENIWVPSHLNPEVIEEYKVGRNRGFLDDAIVKLSPDGDVIYEKSVSEIFIENEMEYLLFAVGANNFFVKDPIHLNDIQPADSDTKFWKKGDVFLSLRHQSMIMLFRPSTNEIIWKSTQMFFHPHDVDILDDHRISVFNNNSKDLINGDIVDGHNEVIIFNFETGEYSSYHKASMEKYDVRTITQGQSEILPDGSLIVEESNYGRTLYFGPEGSLRWSHVNKANDGNVYTVGWSRILHTEEDIDNVNQFLSSRKNCTQIIK